MQESNQIHDRPTAEFSSAITRRILALFLVAFALLLLVLLPPYLNVSRLQRRVARNISASLGRPVHFDQITLDLLPMPGFTLQNFVVDEDPVFGFEPILRASQVRVNIRLRSIWSSHVEISRISLTDPSVNLVQTADGQWNIGELLLQTSRTPSIGISAALTSDGTVPQLPYIEASGARLNFKLDQEKTPFSLTDADFALWLPQPHQWRLRLKAHPVRTDTGPADTGTVNIEATLGPASPSADLLANLPIELHGSWQDVELGGLSRLLFANDAGLRGELAMSLDLLGTLGQNNITADIQLNNARRADFVPPHLLSIEVGCRAIAQNTLTTYTKIECRLPPSITSNPKLLMLTADLPDIRQPSSTSATLSIPALPADTFLYWLSVATPHPPIGLVGPGTLAGKLSWGANPPSVSTKGLGSNLPTLTGELEFSDESLQLAGLGPKAIPLGALLLRSIPLADRTPHQRSAIPSTQSANFDLASISLPLGGKQPAILEGHLDASGYTLHLTGTVVLERLLALGDAIPQLGDGLRQLLQPISSTIHTAPSQKSNPMPASIPIRIDLTAVRAWGGPQVWSQTAHP